MRRFFSYLNNGDLVFDLHIPVAVFLTGVTLQWREERLKYVFWLNLKDFQRQVLMGGAVLVFPFFAFVAFFFPLKLQIRKEYSEDDNFLGVKIISFT